MIAGLFDDWNEALATKDPEQVANMYAHDAVLLPTVSNEVMRQGDCRLGWHVHNVWVVGATSSL